MNGPPRDCYVQHPKMQPRGSEGSLRSWAVPSLLVGAVATLVDVGVLLAAIRWLHASSAEAAMLGVAVGSTVAFAGNRRFAFRSSARAWVPEALRFLAGTTVGMGVHAMLVRTLADVVGVPVVLAKLASDVCVFTFGPATYCPDCLLAGPSRAETSGIVDKGVLSIVLAVVGAGITAAFFLGGTQFGQGAAMILSYPWIASTIGGAALALIARDGARRRGSVLPTIGLVANGVLIAIQLTLTIMGNFSGK